MRGARRPIRHHAISVAREQLPNTHATVQACYAFLMPLVTKFKQDELQAADELKAEWDR